MKQVPQVGVTGPLAPYAEGFRQELLRQGYTPLSARSQMYLMAHLSRWLSSKGLRAEGLIAQRVEEFLDARRAAGYRAWVSPRGISLLLSYLRQLGVVPPELQVAPSNAVDQLLLDYHRYLVAERGLASSTVRGFVDLARRFLSTCFPSGELAVAELSARQVGEFALTECARRTAGSAKSTMVRLRSLLRYFHVSGRTPASLVAAVPSGPSWSHASLPRGIDPARVARLLASCDRTTVKGCREFAILTLLVRLGLRAGEVAGLGLDDLDWRAGEILIRGKGARIERLPLPVDVGEALTAWLRQGRPQRALCRNVFIKLRAPHGPIATTAVSSMVARAAERAGIGPVSAHQLRHTAATALLRAGAKLAEVGQVLRHRSQLSTAIYAKVDRAALSVLVRPWPGGGR